jgi:hypothetical protein
MSGPAQYLHWGFILISVANLIVIGLLIVVFVLAVLLRRPGEPRASVLDPATSGVDTGPADEEEV